MTTLERLIKELLLLKNEARQRKDVLLKSDTAYFWYQREIAKKQRAIASHKKQLEDNKKK
jgi:hypothetical protein